MHVARGSESHFPAKLPEASSRGGEGDELRLQGSTGSQGPDQPELLREVTKPTCRSGEEAGRLWTEAEGRGWGAPAVQGAGQSPQ